MTIELNDITVAITSYRRPDALNETLETLSDVPNVNVVLNGSGLPEYGEVMANHAGRVKFAQNLFNIGVAATANRLVMEAGTRYVVFSTDACDYAPGWWEPLLHLLNSETPPLQVSLSAPRRFASTCIDKKMMGLQGFYDHNFTQVYYEDEDWFLRTLERKGLAGQDVDLGDVMPVLSVVQGRASSKTSWNSIPNRTYFWKKWRRVDGESDDYLRLRSDVAVERRLPDPVFPYLETVRAQYQSGDYSAVPFVYDPPTSSQQRLTRWTTNPVVTRSRHFVSKVTNPTQRLR